MDVLEISGFEWELGFHKHVEKEEIISRKLNSPFWMALALVPEEQN